VPMPGAGGPLAEAPLARFEPLAAYPNTTQVAVRAVLLGSAWLTRMNQAQGRFLPGYRPALRQPTDGDHDLKQARAALALAQAAKFSGDDRQAVVAGQAILALLTVTRVDPADPNSRVPIRSSLTCNRVGFAAVLALAIYELPAADEKLLAEAERLCEFLRKQLRPDGSVHYADGPDDAPTKVDPAGVTEYPGAALHALAAGNRVRPAPWKPDAVKKGVAYYRAWFKANPHPMLAATLTPAFTELYLQTRSADAAAGVFELNDWLVGLQYAATDPQHPMWAGGFKGWANGQPVEAEPGYECGAYLQSLACAYHLTRLDTDLTRAARYRQCTLDAAQFLTGLQYLETNTRHFENTFRANVLIGGFFLSTTDGNLRIDASAWAVTGLLRFLSSGAER
ncbi:MAG: hypothetical protein JWO38_7670, partial [Gemmataceae bacterium]|nr:hypothetical protein [Gemmataceae bacterium]